MSIASFSIESFDRMVETGAFGPEEYPNGVELIRGEVVPMSPAADPEHDYLIDLLMNWSVASTQDLPIQVRVQNSVGLPAFVSIPAPDLAWVSSANYRRERPTAQQVQLIIEVSNSTLNYDRNRKAALYAEAGIQEYWIVNLRDEVLEVHRKPTGDAYAEKITVGKQETIAPLAAPDVQLVVGDLWRDA